MRFRSNTCTTSRCIRRGLTAAPNMWITTLPPIARRAVSGGSQKKMSTMSLDLWQRGCERLAAELPEQQYNTWIRPLAPTPAGADGTDVVAVSVPNRFKLDWIRTQYADRIESVLTDLAGKPVRLELTLAPRVDVPQGAAPQAAHGGTMASAAAIAAAALDRAAGNGNHPASARRRRGARAGACQHAPPPEHGADLRHPGRRPREPDGSHGRAARGRRAGRHVQPAVHLRRRRPGQDASGACRGQRAAQGQPAAPACSTCTPSSSSATSSRTTSARPSTN